MKMNLIKTSHVWLVWFFSKAPSICLLSINPHSWISARPKVSRLHWTMIVPSWIFLPLMTENSRILELLRTNKQNNNRNKNKKADGYIETHVTLKDMAVEDQKHLHMFSGWYIIRKAGTVWLPQRPYFTTFYLGLWEGGFHLQPTNVNDLNAAVMDRVFFFLWFPVFKRGEFLWGYGNGSNDRGRVGVRNQVNVSE